MVLASGQKSITCQGISMSMLRYDDKCDVCKLMASWLTAHGVNCVALEGASEVPVYCDDKGKVHYGDRAVEMVIRDYPGVLPCVPAFAKEPVAKFVYQLARVARAACPRCRSRRIFNQKEE